MPAKERRKGASFERAVAKRLRHIYPGARRTLEYQEGKGYDLEGTGHFRIQCKNWKSYAPITRLEEAASACEGRQVPVLITKGLRQPAVAVMYEGDWRLLLESYERLRSVEEKLESALVGITAVMESLMDLEPPPVLGVDEMSVAERAEVYADYLMSLADNLLDHDLDE